MVRTSAAFLAVLGVGLSACARPAPPPPEPAPVFVVAEPVVATPIDTTPMAPPAVDPVVEVVAEGELIDLDDDSDVIGLDTDTAEPLAPPRRPECLPSLETSGDPDCQAPEAEPDVDLDVDTGIELEPLSDS